MTTDSDAPNAAERPAAVRPTLGRGVYIAPTAYVGGRVTLGDECTVMHQVVIRGDVSEITIGARVNVQDGTVIHTRGGVPLEIADDVSIGHLACVHCRSVGPFSLIGIKSTVLDNARVGGWCIVAAGAVVTPGTIIPDGKLALGTPARVVRDVTDEERAYIRYVVENYRKLGRAHAAGAYPNWSA
ncbi:MAG TPA: gamma carbonic anhydrase family protein [Phycisphaerae bacterium]|nr:gamma carbonic anhydrase family protein [Phycisphaerae bacterium]